ELEERLQIVLFRAKVVTTSGDNNSEYFESRIDKLIYRQEKAEANPNRSPYSVYFVFPTSKGYSLTAYNTSYELSKESDPDQFDFFFALSLLICDEMEINNFLAYHLQNSFNNKINDYKDFLTPLFVKYSYFVTRY
nr:hypothetical protein [Chitinophagaceae bacterium]